jgi:two-component system sensor histidine kinase MprB
MSLRRRLTLLSALAVAVAVALASVIVYAVVRHQLLDQIDSTIQDGAMASRVVVDGRTLTPGEGGGPPLPGGPGAPYGGAPGAPSSGSPGPQGSPRGGNGIRFPQPGGGFLPVGQLINAGGKVLVPPARGPRLPVSSAARGVAAGTRGQFFADLSVDGSELRVLTTPAGPGRALQVARPLSEVNQTLSNLRLTLVIVCLGGVALAALLGLLVARGALAPAVAVSGAAEDVARTRDLTRRIEVRGSDELARLARSFNEMMAALEASESARRRLVADASHELRTPLATLRTNIETLAHGEGLDDAGRAQIVADLEAELEDLGGLVADVVELAREPEEPRLGEAEVRLDEIAAAAVGRARRRARGLSFDTELEPWLVRGDPGRLDRAIWNLLDNAIKWSPEGGAVEVRLTGGALSVRDHGPGFSESDLPHAFDRFYRADEARGKPGSGLGLAIAARITREHGGEARAANAGGGGAVVTLALPGEAQPALAAS